MWQTRHNDLAPVRRAPNPWWLDNELKIQGWVVAPVQPPSSHNPIDRVHDIVLKRDAENTNINDDTREEEGEAEKSKI